MRLRQSIFAVSFFASLLGTSFMVDARTLTPESEWQVSKVDVAQGDAYCTLARQYEVNSVVTFARNAAGEGTIALDFQRDVFDKTRSYPVTLQAGQVLRQYVIKPANDTAIIMRTSTDASLFEAMRDTGSLRVQIDKEIFTIDLSNYAQSLQDLYNCVGGSESAATEVAQRTPRPPKNMVNQVDDQDSLNNQDVAIAELVDENAKLVRELQGERTSFREKIANDTGNGTALNQATAMANKDILNKLAAAEQKNGDLLRRIASLESQLSARSTSMNPDVSGALKEQETQIDLLRGQKDRLQAMLDEERTKRVALENQVASLQSSSQQSSTLGADSVLNKELERKIEELAAQNTSLRQQLAARADVEPQVIVKENIKEVPVAAVGTPDEIIALNERLSEAETSSLSLKAERDEYRALLQRERQRLKEMSDLGQNVSDASVQSGNMIEQIKKLESEKIDLIRRLEFVQANGATAGAGVDTSSAIQNRLDTVTQESEQAKQQLRIIAADKKAVEDRLKLAELEAADAKRQLASMKVNKVANGANDADISVLESEIASLEAQNRMLREDLAAVDSREPVARDDSQAMIASLEQKYQTRLSVVEQENIRLARELSDEQNKAPVIVREVVEVDFDSAPTPAPVKATAPTKIAEVSLPSMQPAKVQVPTQQQTVSANAARQQLRNKITGKAIAPSPSNAPEPTQTGALKTRPVQTVAVQKQAPQPVSLAALSGDEIRQLVAQAGVPLVSNIERVNEISGPDFAAFRWDTGTVYGSGEQSKMANDSAFDAAISRYIAKTQDRCQGEFDKTVIALAPANGLTARAADIACVQNSDNGAAASIVFFAYNGMFYALAHESDLDHFQTAMDMRDRMAGKLSSIF